MHEYEASRLDYTQERRQFLPDWDAATLVKKAREKGAGDDAVIRHRDTATGNVLRELPRHDALVAAWR